MARSVRGSKARSVIPGHKVGAKRRDMRWLAPDGTEWDSKFEYEIFLTYQKVGLSVRRTNEQDRLLFTRPVRNGACTECDSCSVVSRHYYTPDIYVGAADDRERSGLQATGYYVEAKGYLRAEQRSLLRSLRKARPDVDLRLIVQRDYKVTSKLTITEWARKYLRVRAHVWNGTVPAWDEVAA